LLLKCAAIDLVLQKPQLGVQIICLSDVFGDLAGRWQRAPVGDQIAARTFDKHVYSPWTGTDLHQQLNSAGIDTVIITGGETDVCVLATMLGAIDWGFRVILVTDALCSSAAKLTRP